MISKLLKVVLPLLVLGGAAAVASALIAAKEEPKPRPPEDRRPLVNVIAASKSDWRSSATSRRAGCVNVFSASLAGASATTMRLSSLAGVSSPPVRSVQ